MVGLQSQVFDECQSLSKRHRGNPLGKPRRVNQRLQVPDDRGGYVNVQQGLSDEPQVLWAEVMRLAGHDHLEVALGDLVQPSGEGHGRLAIPEVFLDPVDRVADVDGGSLALIAHGGSGWPRGADILATGAWVAFWGRVGLQASFA